MQRAPMPALHSSICSWLSFRLVGHRCELLASSTYSRDSPYLHFRQALYPAEVLAYDARAKGLAFLGVVVQASSLINTFALPIALEKITWKGSLTAFPASLVANVRHLRSLHYFHSLGRVRSARDLFLRGRNQGLHTGRDW